jgi:hypothetical protein
MKNLPPKHVMDANISTMMFIRCSGFVHRRLHLPLEKCEAEHSDISYRAAREMIRVEVLKRFFHLRSKVYIFSLKILNEYRTYQMKKES